MDYSKIYNNLIERALGRQIIEFAEVHHIIPICMGGSDDEVNLVKLTPEEHYIAHQLLVKIYPENTSLIFAANMMTVGRNNKKYGWLKRKHSDAVSKRQSGKNNSQFGTIWITNGSENKKISNELPIPDDWYRGRTLPNMKGRPSKLKGKPGHKWTESQYAERSKRVTTDETRKKISENNFAKRDPEAHREHMAKASKLRWQKLKTRSYGPVV